MLVRRVLAFPLYLVAFTLHLLTTFFSIAAQKVAGDDHMTPRWINVASVTVITCAVGVGLTLWGYERLNVPVQSPTALVVQTPMTNWRDIPAGFTPENVVWARPLVKLTACIFTQRAVRHSLGPAAQVQFDPCGEGGKNTVTVDDDYYEMSVSGKAQINGEVRPFKVNLNHYPPSTSEWGFVATGIEIEKPEEATCACPK